MHGCFWAWMALAVAVLFWGLSFVGIKIALGEEPGSGVPPLVLLAIRFGIGALVFGPVFWRMGALGWSRNRHLRLLGMAACLPGAYFIFETYAVSLTTASKAGLIAACIPVTVLLLGATLQRRTPSMRVVGGALLALAGVAGLVLGEAGVGAAELAGLNPGDGLMLLAVLAAAGYMVHADVLGRELGGRAVTAAQMLWGAIFFVPLGLWQGAGLEVSQVAGDAWLATLGLALFPTIAAFWAYNYALARLEASRASLGINLVPLVSALGAWAILGESLTMGQAMGGGAILAGVLLATRQRKACDVPAATQ